MRIESLVQGSDEWLNYRRSKYNASDASAMLGLSRYKSRTALLDEMASGISPEFDAATMARFAEGHRAEDATRPMVEAIIGQDLYAVTCSEGDLSASCDGLTFDADLPLIAFENKLWNAALAASVARNDLPEEYMPQCQQIMLVTGAEQVIFVCSDGTKDKMVHMRVYPDKSWFERIIAGWAEFGRELESHSPQAKVEKPQAEVIMGLPALSIQVKGDVSIAGNLPRFREEADGYLKGIKISGFQTDKDFVDAEENAKFCRGTETALELTKTNILAQTATVDEVIKVVDYYREQFRRVAIDLEKAVKNEKEARKLAIINEARTAYVAHVASLEAELAGIKLSGLAAPDFAGAAKNMRKLDSLQDAVNTALAGGRIMADAAAKDVRDKLAWLGDNVGDFGFLFADRQQIITKPMDDFRLLVETRIKAHQDAEAAKVEQIREEERIKAEAKARAEAEAKLREEQTAIAAEEVRKQAQLVESAKVAVKHIPTEPSLPELAKRISGAGTIQKPRPTDDAIVGVLAQYYHVSEPVVLGWLHEFDFEAQVQRVHA